MSEKYYLIHWQDFANLCKGWIVCLLNVPDAHCPQFADKKVETREVGCQTDPVALEPLGQEQHHQQLPLLAKRSAVQQQPQQQPGQHKERHHRQKVEKVEVKEEQQPVKKKKILPWVRVN